MAKGDILAVQVLSKPMNFIHLGVFIEILANPDTLVDLFTRGWKEE